MGNTADKQAIIDDANKKAIPTNKFNFRGMTYVNAGGHATALYPICQYCQMCGCKRYTDEQVKLFSNPELTPEQYYFVHKQPIYVTGAICNEMDCAQKLFVLSGGYNNYSMHFAFDNYEEAMKAMQKVQELKDKEAKVIAIQNMQVSNAVEGS